MRGRLVLTGLAAIAILGSALLAGAQGPPPGGFGGRGPGAGLRGPMAGQFELERLVGAIGGKTVTGHAFQAKFSITHTQTLAGNNTITNTSTGILARDNDGDTYREVKLAAIGPWASSGKSQEFVYIRNVSKQMDYVITNGTYEAWPSPPQNSAAGGNPNHRRRGEDPGPNVTVRDNPSATFSDGGATFNKVDDKIITRTIPAGQIGNKDDVVITTERWYSPDLQLVLQVVHSDPRFGTSTYKLTNIEVGMPTVSFLPDPSLQLVPTERFGRRGPRGAGKQPPPPLLPPGN